MNEQLNLGAWATPRYDPALGQWHTPPWLAAMMVEWADVRPGMTVLEPSAGGGAIVKELIRAGAVVDAVEIDQAWAASLRTDFPDVITIVADFLSLLPTHSVGNYGYDLEVMNPPLDGGAGPTHIAHALKFAPRVVSILRTVDLHGVDRNKVLWSQHALAGIRWLVRRPVFSGDESRSPGSGAQADFVVVDVRREFTGNVDVGWW